MTIGYLPAAAAQFTKPDGETVTVYRPYEAFAAELLEQHAAEGDEGAMLELGERYYYGVLGVEQDYERAYTYLKQAAEKNVQDAQALLAQYYLREEIPVLEQDVKKGIELLKLAAENGSWRALVQLSQIYRTGRTGVFADHEQACDYAVQAVQALLTYWNYYTQKGFIDFAKKQKELLDAHSRLTLMLADYNADGIGTKRDIIAALRWVEIGEQFVCRATGLRSVSMFQLRRQQLQERIKKEAQRRKDAERAAAKKKKKK